MYFAGKTVPQLCSVRPALTIFILMADLGFLRTTEYTGYSCPSNKTLLFSHSRGKKEVQRDTKRRSSQPSEPISRFNVISRAFMYGKTKLCKFALTLKRTTLIFIDKLKHKLLMHEQLHRCINIYECLFNLIRGIKGIDHPKYENYFMNYPHVVPIRLSSKILQSENFQSGHHKYESSQKILD